MKSLRLPRPEIAASFISAISRWLAISKNEYGTRREEKIIGHGEEGDLDIRDDGGQGAVFLLERLDVAGLAEASKQIDRVRTRRF